MAWLLLSVLSFTQTFLNPLRLLLAMLYNKTGFPEESEIVMCTVTSVQYNSVFITLDHFGGRTGIIHISEVSPGRIRNIRDYVKEGKKVICKVLRINRERGHIDLSLRRVTESQKRNMNTQIKQEMLAEKIISFAAKELKTTLEKLYDTVSKKVFEQYDLIYTCFEDVATGEFTLDKLGLDKKLTEKLDFLIKQRIKPPEVALSGKFAITVYDENGVGIIKDAFKKAEDEFVTVTYAGAGNYNILVKSEDYKTAEKILEKFTNFITEFIEEHDGEAEFTRLGEKKEKTAL